MKNRVSILLFTLLLFTPFVVSAQTTTTEDKKKAEKELMLKKAEEEKKSVEERQKELQFFQNMRAEEIEKAMDEARVAYRISSDGLGGLGVVSTGIGEYFNQSSNSTTMEYSKKLKESSYSKEFSFDVEKDAVKASISVSGSCTLGEVRIKILTPGGKTYTEVLIDEYGSVNWNKSFSIDEEATDKSGIWKFTVTAKNATGSFRIGVRSN